MRIHARIALALASLLLPLALLAEDAPGPFSFADPTVRILSTEQNGSGEITLRSTADQPKAPVVEDVELPHPAAATVKFAAIADASAPPKSWRFTVVVSGLLPANAMQQRYAKITYGDQKTQYLPYTLTNQAAGSFTWIISKPPDPWVHSDWLPGSGCTAFVVTPKGSPATGLTLGSSSLVEQSTKEGITVQDLRLCRGESCSADESGAIDLPADVPSKLQLCTTRSFHGNYRGAVTLASLQKPEGDSILASADLSSCLVKLAGAGLILAGVLLAWWSKVWARARLERDQALLPAIVMRTQLASLQQVLVQLRAPYHAAATNLNNAISTLLGELQTTVLDQNLFVPSRFPNPFGDTANAAAYKAYLEARNPRVQLFSALIRQGVVPAEAQDNGTLNAAQQALVVTAVSNIDLICTNLPQPTADQALALVQPILTNLHNALFPPAPDIQLAPQPPQAPPTAAREYEVLSIEMQSISTGVWLVYGVLTVLTGFAVLILNNPGFGVPVDLLFAFFWGFGLPTTIGALAPGSAATALNIPIAKS